jgi:hypothetical protein
VVLRIREAELKRSSARVGRGNFPQDLSALLMSLAMIERAKAFEHQRIAVWLDYYRGRVCSLCRDKTAAKIGDCAGRHAERGYWRLSCRAPGAVLYTPQFISESIFHLETDREDAAAFPTTPASFRRGPDGVCDGRRFA